MSTANDFEPRDEREHVRSQARKGLDAMLQLIARNIDLEEQWDQELEIMGATASEEQLHEHLARAPNPASENAIYLTGYLAHLGLQRMSSRH